MKHATIAIWATLLLAGCAGTPENRPTTLSVTLTGLQEVPGPGDPDGTGTVEIRVDPRSGQVCWDLYARQVEAATAAHIHRGPAGTAGPPVITLTTPDASGRSRGCATVDVALATSIATQGPDHYVNVHNEAHPAGAIRGQLRGGNIMRQERRRTEER